MGVRLGVGVVRVGDGASGAADAASAASASVGGGGVVLEDTERAADGQAKRCSRWRAALKIFVSRFTLFS